MKRGYHHEPVDGGGGGGRTFPNKHRHPNHHRGGGHRGRGRGHHQAERHGNDAASTSGAGGHANEGSRPPSNLRGRALGMWYAQRSKANQQKRDEDERPVLRVPWRQLQDLRTTLQVIRQEAHMPPAAMDSSSSDVELLDEPDDKDWHTPGPMHQQQQQQRGGSAALLTDMDEEDDDDDDDFEQPWRLEDEAAAVDDENFAAMSAIGELSTERQLELNRSLRQDLESRRQTAGYQRMLAQRQQLPMMAMQQQVLDSVRQHQINIISGETGSGKSTQVPQLILDERLGSEQGAATYIVCTQPRRISATSLAMRVADERCEALSDSRTCSVGYQIRLGSKRPRPNGSLLYCTTGILMQWMVHDRQLSRVSHVILDEVHERDVNCDFMLILLKQLCRQRPDLKLILMSATLNDLHFADYLDVPHDRVLRVPGRQFEVKRHFLEDVFQSLNYVPPSAPRKKRWSRRQPTDDELIYRSRLEKDASVVAQVYGETIAERVLNYDVPFGLDYPLITQLVEHILDNSAADESILIFVPGWYNIKHVSQALGESAAVARHRPRLLPLHSLLPFADQMSVFKRPPPGQRKIVIATCIAETSITIDDIVHVIDTGKTKMSSLDQELNVQTLTEQWNAQANCRQRQGRAGRVREGRCYHLMTRTRYNCMPDYHAPEMCRIRLDSLILRILLMQLGDPMELLSRAPDPPAAELVQLSANELCCLGAIRWTNAGMSLTPLGRKMAQFPVSPVLAKMIILGAVFSCLDPILTVAACLDYKEPFNTPMDKEAEVADAKRRLADGAASDHLLWVNVHRQYAQLKHGGGKAQLNQWAWQHFVNLGTLTHIDSIKQQYAKLLSRTGFIPSADLQAPLNNVNSDSQKVILAIVCAALYPNIAQTPPGKGTNAAARRPLTGKTKRFRRVETHSASVNQRVDGAAFQSRYVCYHKLVKSDAGISMYDCSEASPLAMVLFSGDVDLSNAGANRHDQQTLLLDNWIWFYANAGLVSELRRIRRDLQSVLVDDHRSASAYVPRLMQQVADLFDQESVQRRR